MSEGIAHIMSMRKNYERGERVYIKTWWDAVMVKKKVSLRSDTLARRLSTIGENISTKDLFNIAKTLGVSTNPTPQTIIGWDINPDFVPIAPVEYYNELSKFNLPSCAGESAKEPHCNYAQVVTGLDCESGVDIKLPDNMSEIIDREMKKGGVNVKLPDNLSEIIEKDYERNKK